MGASYNGSTGVSKTSCVSSILAAPALPAVALAKACLKNSSLRLAVFFYGESGG